MKNFALVKAGIVDNVVIVDDATDGGRAYLAAMAEEFDDVVEVTGTVSIGHEIAGAGTATGGGEVTP